MSLAAGATAAATALPLVHDLAGSMAQLGQRFQEGKLTGEEFTASKAKAIAAALNAKTTSLAADVALVQSQHRKTWSSKIANNNLRFDRS